MSQCHSPKTIRLIGDYILSLFVSKRVNASVSCDKLETYVSKLNSSCFPVCLFSLKACSLHEYVVLLQLMEAGTSGANGPCAAASVRGRGVGSATPQLPDTEARRVKGAARPQRTAQMDCVPRVRPSSASPSSMLSSPCHYHLHICIQYTMTSHHLHVKISIKINHSVDWHRCLVHGKVTAHLLCAAGDMTYCMSYWICHRLGSADIWLDWWLTFVMKHRNVCTCIRF